MTFRPKRPPELEHRPVGDMAKKEEQGKKNRLRFRRSRKNFDDGHADDEHADEPGRKHQRADVPLEKVICAKGLSHTRAETSGRRTEPAQHRRRHIVFLGITTSV